MASREERNSLISSSMKKKCVDRQCARCGRKSAMHTTAKDGQLVRLCRYCQFQPPK